MNNEFEWRSEMRKLGAGVEPTRDLWPTIAAQLATRSTAWRNRLPVPVAIAYAGRRHGA